VATETVDENKLIAVRFYGHSA